MQRTSKTKIQQTKKNNTIHKIHQNKKNKKTHKPTVGFFCFTCCEGCGFTVLFLDNLTKILDSVEVLHFNLIKEKNSIKKLDLAFIEGAITTKKEAEELIKIRKKSKFLVTLGACACHGGIPAMRNFIENAELQKYTYNQKLSEDSIQAQSVEKFVKVDYHMYGCPILKSEFSEFISGFLSGSIIKEYEGPVCNQCPRRGVNCFLREKRECLGAITNGGCNAICIREEIPCIMCRGPLNSANFPAEITLFKSFGLEEKDIISKLGKFGEQKIKEMPK